MKLFQEIRRKELSPEYQKLTLGNSELLKEIIFTTALDKISVDRSTIEETIKRLRQDPDSKPTVKDKANILAFTKALDENIIATKSKIKEIKDTFSNEITNAKDKHVFNITNNPELVKFATNVFQEKKEFITADDFLILIELKKQIEMNEIIKFKESNI